MKEFIDKLIESLEEQHERCINRYGIVGGNAPAMEVKQCIDIVNELAEEYKGGWIPCSERLPSKANHNVLVTYKDRYIGGVYGVCEGQYVHSLKEWQITDYAIDDDFNVIAWCEKPAPYTEGE